MAVIGASLSAWASVSHTLPSAREVQSELSQVVRIIGFFRLAPSAQLGHVRVGVVADRRWRDGAPGETSEPFHAPIQRAVVAGFNGITHRAGEGVDTRATPSSMDVPIRPLRG